MSQRRDSPDGPRWLPLLAALATILPAPRAALPGLSYYFRDFSQTYYPLRAYFASEIAAGRWPFWNPYLHEGCAYLPMFYPLELAQLLWPGPAFVSWLLTLHLPIAALASYGLARELGASRWGAAAAGAAFGLSGLALSTLSLHWFLQALALTPLVALAFRRAARLGGRSVALAAIVLALAVSTLAVEFVAQALLLGIALGLSAQASPRAGARLLLGASLGAGLAGVPIAMMLGIVGESLRGAGVPAAQALQGSLHPLALLQVLLPSLYGSLSEPLRFWWGGRLFAAGSPYFMSLYLGPAALALAATGVGTLSGRERRVLAALAALALWYALGSFGGLAPLLAPAVSWFRFPVKAILLPTLAAALFAGFGVDRLRRGEGWRAILVAASAGAALVAAVGVGLAVSGDAAAAWLDISPRAEAAMRATLRVEVGQALLIAAGLAALAIAVQRGGLRPARAALLVGALLVIDLWHAGLGLNPQTAPAFFAPVPGLAEALADANGGRVFSYGVEASPMVGRLLAERRPGVERASLLLSRQTLNPFANVADGVEVAEGPDRLSFIPAPPALARFEYDPAMVDAILPRLRNEAVSRIVSLDPLEHRDLRPRAVLAAAAGFEIHVYDVDRPWPRAYLGCRVRAAAARSEALRRPFADPYDPGRDVVLEEPGTASCTPGSEVRREGPPGEQNYTLTSDGPGYLVIRDSFSPSWRASVDGLPTRVLRESGRHRAVPVGAGRHHVVLRYEPPGLHAGLWITALSAAGVIFVWAAPRQPTRSSERKA